MGDKIHEEHTIYRDRAKLYDLIYHAKDYTTEAARIGEILVTEGVAEGSWITEAACGTGRYMEQLRQCFRVSGFDINEPMLAIARARLPGVPLFRADMANFELEEPADAIVCLFSSISYLQSSEQLSAAARCFCRALRSDGVLLIEPFVDPNAFEPGRPHLDTYQDEDIKLARMIVSRREGAHAVLDFFWLVAQRGDRVQHFAERHVLRLYRHEELEQTLDTAGFDTYWNAHGLIPDRGLIVARRR